MSATLYPGGGYFGEYTPGPLGEETGVVAVTGVEARTAIGDVTVVVPAPVIWFTPEDGGGGWVPIRRPVIAARVRGRGIAARTAIGDVAVRTGTQTAVPGVAAHAHVRPPRVTARQHLTWDQVVALILLTEDAA